MSQIRIDQRCPKCDSPCYIEQDSDGLFMACVYSGHVVREDPYEYPSLPKENPFPGELESPEVHQCFSDGCQLVGTCWYKGDPYCSGHAWQLKRGDKDETNPPKTKACLECGGRAIKGYAVCSQCRTRAKRMAQTHQEVSL